MSSKKTAASKDDTISMLVPKLRFPEFRGTDVWDRLPLREVTTSLLDGDWIESKDQSDTGYRLIQTGNVGVGEFIAKSGKARYVSIETFSRLRCTEIFPGDCLVSRLPDPAGRSCFIPDTGERMITAVDCTIVRFDQTKIVPYLFIAHSQTDCYFREVAALSSGSTRQRISRENLSGLLLSLPPSLAEQQKIAKCLSSLDAVIAAQARKVETLKAHKKGLMQQLFPREGETQPRLRFPEFHNAGEWERTSLGGVARLRNGYAFRSAEYVADGPYQIITIANVQQGNLTLESTKRMAALPPDIQKHQVLDIGDILISMTGNVGRVCLVTAEGLLLNQRVGKLVPDTIEATFFYQLLQRDEFRNTMQLKAAGGAQGNLSAGDITEYAFTAPTDAAEQHRIASCLSSLDALITAETQKLAALKTHKRGLMQQLFPAPEVVE